MSQIEHPPLPQRPGERLAWRGLEGGATSLAACRAAERFPVLTLVLTADSAAAYRTVREVEFFREDPALDVLMLPDWETLPYDAFSPHQDITSERLLTLHRLPKVTRAVLVVPMKTVMQRLPPRSFLAGHVVKLAVGEQLDPHRYRTLLEQAGYRS